MSALRFDTVGCARGGRLLFENLTFGLGPGDAALVSGSNGAGKSSLIRIAAGLLAPATGAVEVAGSRALLTEAAALDPELSVAAALRFWARIDGHAEAVMPALAAVGLDGIAQVPVRLLSTGQRRRAALARVVASEAPIWLLDEPANGLDTASVRTLESLITGHRRAGGIALVATHLPIALPDAREIAL